MRVGSLHNPWEFDGRLPPDAGYYLDLVLPRFEEPRKKIGSRVRLLHGRILQIQWSIHMQLYSGISANLLVTLVKTPANLLVKLTKSGQGGHGGGPYPSTRASRGCILAPPDRGAMGVPSNPIAASPSNPWMVTRLMRLMRLVWDYLLGILLELLGVLLGILLDVLGFI